MDNQDPESEKLKDLNVAHAVAHGNKVIIESGTIDDLDPLEDE